MRPRNRLTSFNELPSLALPIPSRRGHRSSRPAAPACDRTEGTPQRGSQLHCTARAWNHTRQNQQQWRVASRALAPSCFCPLSYSSLPMSGDRPETGQILTTGNLSCLSRPGGRSGERRDGEYYPFLPVNGRVRTGCYMRARGQRKPADSSDCRTTQRDGERDAPEGLRAETTNDSVRGRDGSEA